MDLTDTDAKIVDRLQRGIAVAGRPFVDVAAELGVAEDWLIERLQCLLDNGVLSRFGPMFNADVLGGAYCLCAMSVPADDFEEVCQSVNRLPEVAHNYQRDHELNMWFVLATETPERIEEVIGAIENETGLAVLDFPKEKEFFVELILPVNESMEDTTLAANTQ